ncbi:hypothetical protein ACFX4I_24185 [Peribacillus sp. YIM B13472]|uniref:hypothetical protein n=1 Tax=Peribacillus sp. YIM B13472 TaxID=3366297 RepID=UPI00366BB67E
MGRETALQLSTKGASVVIADFNEQSAKEAVDEIEAASGIGLVKPFLEMDPESYHRVIDVD